MKNQVKDFADSAGFFAISWLKEMEKRGFRYVYLRNYELLPKDVGNDIDLLIEQGKTKQWVDLAPALATPFGWRFLRAVSFGCTSLFFFREDRDSIVHVDLNERLEWHCVPIADEKTILSQRKWNGKVFIPTIADELYLNMTTRLVYQGRVREKHRSQWLQMRSSCLDSDLEKSFSRLGSLTLTHKIIRDADSGNWSEIESLHAIIRRHLLRQSMTHAPKRLFTSTYQFIIRSIGRIVSPPGLVFLFQITPNSEEIMLPALQMATPRLAKWGNLSECRIDGARSRRGRKRWMFRTKNGVVVCWTSQSGLKRRSSSRTILVPISTENHRETAEELAGHIIQNARSAVVAKFRRC